MNLQEQLRLDRGTPYVYENHSNPTRPMLRFTPKTGYDIASRKASLNAHVSNKHVTIHEPTPIPEDDLRILTKIYNKEYHECGRKRRALLRYIKYYRETAEPVNHSRRLFKHIEKLVRRSR